MFWTLERQSGKQVKSCPEVDMKNATAKCLFSCLFSVYDTNISNGQDDGRKIEIVLLFSSCAINIKLERPN